MFQILTASAPPPQTCLHRVGLAIWLHAVLLAGAVALTRQPAVAPVPRVAWMPVAVDPLRPPPTASVRPDRLRSAREAIAPPPAQPPVGEATELPTLPLEGSSLADLLAGAELSSDAASRALARTGDAGGDDHSGNPTGAFSPAAVDQPVEILHQPAVRYPPSLAQAGVPGRVEIEFVVDTVGRVEPGSVRALNSTHLEFEAAARAAILATRFRPARWQGRPVRQLVRQALTFRAEAPR